MFLSLLDPETVLILQCLPKLVGISMRQDAEIRLQRLLYRFRTAYAPRMFLHAHAKFPKHAPFRPCADEPVMRPENVAEEIDALPVGADRYLPGMQIEPEGILQIGTDQRDHLLQGIFIFREYHEIIGVSDEVPDMQIVFHELVELIEIDIGKKLGGEIANGDAGAAR